MTEPVWLDVDSLSDLHAEQLALFGGPDGIRDHGMLESALGRPLNKFAYGETDLAALAEKAQAGLEALAGKFADENTPYLSLPRPDKAPPKAHQDYAHLARVQEWSLIGGVKDGNGE